MEVRSPKEEWPVCNAEGRVRSRHCPGDVGAPKKARTLCDAEGGLRVCLDDDAEEHRGSPCGGPRRLSRAVADVEGRGTRGRIG